MRILGKDFNKAYWRIQENMTKEFSSQDNAFAEMTQEQRERFIYSLVMCLTTDKFEHQEDYDSAMLCFDAYDVALQLLGTLTPIELERMFPIVKEYDGKRYQSKDYFYTKSILNKLPKDEPINKNTQMTDLLWDYDNNRTREFLIKFMGIMDDIRRLEGQKSMTEEFFKDKGITSYKKFTGANGKEYLQNNQTGEIQPIQKPLPNYLRVVK